MERKDLPRYSLIKPKHGIEGVNGLYRINTGGLGEAEKIKLINEIRGQGIHIW